MGLLCIASCRPGLGMAFHTELDLAGWGAALFADQVSSDQADSLLVLTPW